jgi:hypothetical protein
MGAIFISTLLVIIGYLHFVGITMLPAEADAPLIIDPDTMLPVTATSQLLEPIAGRYRQVMK